jgi:hypothetical protein
LSDGYTLPAPARARLRKALHDEDALVRQRVHKALERVSSATRKRGGKA